LIVVRLLLQETSGLGDIDVAPGGRFEQFVFSSRSTRFMNGVCEVNLISETTVRFDLMV
jgi:hypothetical protein